MTLSELKYIVAVAEEKHFRKAAERCFVSQPTLSVAIKKLEEELELSLFERHKHDVIVTPMGEQIIELAKEILERSQAIRLLAKENKGELHTELKIGAIFTIAPYLFPKLMPLLHQRLPQTPLIVEENYTHVLAEKLKRGDIDIAILSLPFEVPHIETLPVYEEPFKVIAPKQTIEPLHYQAIDISSLESETVLLLGAGHCFRDQVIEAFPNLNQAKAHSRSLQKTFEGSSLETIRYMVASGVGVSILPCSSLSKQDESLLTIQDLPGEGVSRTVAIAWRQNFPRVKVLETVKQALSSLDIPCTIPLIHHQ